MDWTYLGLVVALLALGVAGLSLVVSALAPLVTPPEDEMAVAQPPDPRTIDLGREDQQPPGAH